MENSAPRVPPICRYCNDAIITVKHLLACPALVNERMRMALFRENDQATLKECIGEGASIEQIMEYLRGINAYNSI